MSIFRTTPSLKAVLCFFLITSALSYLLSLNSKDATDYFLEMKINSKVLLYGYNHGLPIVSLSEENHKKQHTIRVPLHAGEYIVSNDSIFKLKGTNHLMIIRDSQEFQIITHWSIFEEPYKSQLTKREVKYLKAYNK